MANARGYNARILVDGSSLCCDRWSVQTDANPGENTTNCGRGFMLWGSNAADAAIRLEGRTGDSPGQDPADLLALRDLGDLSIGSTVDLSILPDSLLSPAGSWHFPTALVTGWAQEASVRGDVRWALTARGSGGWTEPDM
ncbi:MAG TPA: hypothetical protein VEI97_09150 [bacterium]|nr:hypothetical protein [bacterium]